MDAIDTEIPEPVREIDKPFLMSVEDVFSITGRGTVATGRIERGVVKLNETVEIVGLKDTSTTVVTGHRDVPQAARPGPGGRQRRRAPARRRKGRHRARPGRRRTRRPSHPHKKAKAEIYVLSKDEGGRHTPFFNGYRPQFYFRTTDVTGVIELPKGVEMIMPGDNINSTSTLIAPIAMEKTQRFAIREGGRTIGAGRITDIIE